MGMGDQKPPYVPSYTPIRDDVIGKTFPHCCIRQCPHPSVQAKYGVGMVANVSVYTCRKCRFVKTYPYFGGVSCEYSSI